MVFCKQDCFSIAIISHTFANAVARGEACITAIPPSGEGNSVGLFQDNILACPTNAHIMGDRRDHFTTSDDVWMLFRTIVAERQYREIESTVRFLQAVLKLGASMQKRLR